MRVAAQSSTDFYIRNATVQRIAVPRDQTIVIKCYCPSRKATEDANSTELELRFSGTFSSVGYHGDQKKPSSIPEKFMRFTVTKNGSKLTIESHEFQFIHHLFVIDELEVVYPRGSGGVAFDPLSGNSLEGRHIE